MKAAITGHSDGLGKAIADRLAEEGIEIVGFSLDNGYDIHSEESYGRIIEESLDCDVFVNCAHNRANHCIDQVTLLTLMFFHWQDQEKHIISVGSDAPDYQARAYDPTAAKYRAAKTALDAAVTEVNSMSKPCRASIVRPGWIESRASQEKESYSGFKIPKLQYEEVAEVVAMIVEKGPSVNIRSITFARTAKPTVPTKTWRTPVKKWLGRLS